MRLLMRIQKTPWGLCILFSDVALNIFIYLYIFIEHNHSKLPPDPSLFLRAGKGSSGMCNDDAVTASAGIAQVVLALDTG